MSAQCADAVVVWAGDNQPFFEAELRTAIGNDALLLRPYTGVITCFVDGNAEANDPDTIFGTGWTKAANGSYQEAFQSAYDEIEVNRMHGTTFTHLHPFGDSFLNVTYDYHSAFTFDNVGYPDLQIYVAPRVQSKDATLCPPQTNTNRASPNEDFHA